ncbi:MAG: hypothetical protein V9G14_08685 [Cypionkella sp.]
MHPAIASIQHGSAGHAAMKFHVVTKTEDADGLRFLPRNIDDTPIADPDGDIAGYLTPIGEGDPDYAFDGDPENLPGRLAGRAKWDRTSSRQPKRPIA